MAGRGPAPKPPEQRRRRNAPERGEWVDFPPLQKPVLPVLPKRAKGEGAWSARTRRVWAGWRSDPVTAGYGPSELAAVLELAYLFEEMVRGDLKLLSEIRQWTDRLGLNAKGKRDLRWRVVKPVDEVAEARGRREGAPKRRLAAVDPVAAEAK